MLSTVSPLISWVTAGRYYTCVFLHLIQIHCICWLNRCTVQYVKLRALVATNSDCQYLKLWIVLKLWPTRKRASLIQVALVYSGCKEHPQGQGAHLCTAVTMKNYLLNFGLPSQIKYTNANKIVAPNVYIILTISTLFTPNCPLHFTLTSMKFKVWGVDDWLR